MYTITQYIKEQYTRTGGFAMGRYLCCYGITTDVSILKHITFNCICICASYNTTHTAAIVKLLCS